ncbi:MAG: hypothetical protein NVS2B14_06410 [Chamaesiphon sp.]
MTKQKNRSKKNIALANDREIFYKNIKNKISELKQIRTIYPYKMNDESYASKLLPIVFKSINIGQRYLKKMADNDELFHAMDKEITSGPQSSASVDVNWLSHLDNHAYNLASNYINFSSAQSVQEMLNMFTQIQGDIISRYNRQNMNIILNNFPYNLDQGLKVVIGIGCICHDGQIYYQKPQKSLITNSILRGKAIFEDGGNHIFI